DHHAVVYEYQSGVKVFSNCRQQDDCRKDISVYVMGSKGTAVVSEHELSIRAGSKWRYRGKKNNFYQTEHDDLFASIRASKPVNHGEYMSKSTLMAILGRMATYTGQTITWEKAMKSEEDLTPAKYEWGPIKTPPVAMPGQTEFV